MIRLILLFSLQAHAASLNLPGMLRAILFSFEPKVEAITGFPSCEDELNNLIDNLGRRIEEGSSSAWMGAVSREAYNEALTRHRRDQVDRIPLSFDERKVRLRELVPPLKPYQLERFETPESRASELAIHLVEELSKLEKAAAVNRAIRDLEYLAEPSQTFRPLEQYNYPGDRGRAFRLIMLLKDKLKQIEHDDEPGLKIFADAFLIPEIIKESVHVQQLEHTQDLFRWLYDHNHMIYLYLLQKYQSYMPEHILLGFERDDE